MREVTLYENPQHGLSALPFQGGVPVTAVVGITVAQVEAAERAADAYQAEMRAAARERDEARAAARAATEDMADWRDHADRYREALERIAAMTWITPLAGVASQPQHIARQALGGGDD